MKALLQIYARAYRKKYLLSAILAILCISVDIIVALLIPYLSKSIIDEAIPNHDLSQVYQTGLLIISIALASVVSTVLNNIFAQYIASGITCDLRNELFSKIQKLSLANVDRITTGKLLTMVTNDTSQLQQIIVLSFRAILRAPITLIGAMVMAYVTNQNLFIIVLIAVIVLAISFTMIFKKASPLFKSLQLKIDNLNSKLSETIGGAREVKAFVTLLDEEEKFDVVNEDYQKATIRANRVIVLVNPTVSLVSNIAIALVLYFASLMLVKNPNAMMTGTVMTYISYIQQIIHSLMMISTISIFLSRAIVSSDRIKNLLNVKIDIVSQSDFTKEIKGDIEYRNVSFAYHDEDGSDEGITLKNINLVIHQGEKIGIIGSTGSGKTSLVQLIPRLYDVTEGQLLIDGVDVREYELANLRQQIAFVTQEAVIFSGTFLSNIKQGKEDATIEEVKTAAKLACAYEFINQSEKKFDTEVNQGGVNLSGGQRQRLSLARALIRNPKIIILDDATSAVDAKTEKAIKDNLHRLYNVTLLMVAQKISSIIDCDKIIVINNHGEIDGFDTHNELLKVSKVYHEIYESQFGGGQHEF